MHGADQAGGHRVVLRDPAKRGAEGTACQGTRCQGTWPLGCPRTLSMHQQQKLQALELVGWLRMQLLVKHELEKCGPQPRAGSQPES